MITPGEQVFLFLPELWNNKDLPSYPKKIKETITGKQGDKVKVCLEDSDFKDCQTKNLPKDEDSTIKFKLDYKA